MGFSADIDIAGGGAGSSLSVNGGKTNLNADYQAVGEQSGIFANEADLVAEGKGTFKGGVFVTSKAAQDNGKSNIVFQQGIEAEDIQNTSSYDGDAISVGLSVGKTIGKPQATMNGLGYGTEGDSDSSITKGGVSGYNDPQGIFTTENREALAGQLDNVFDETRVNEELGAQTEIIQAFDQERRKIKTELNKEEKELRDEAEQALAIGDEQTAIEKSLAADKVQQKALLFDGISSALYGPNTNGATGYVAKAVSPQVAYQIGQYFKNNDAQNEINQNTELAGVNSPEHLLAHALLGAAVSAATGNDALTGGLSASTGEATAPLISQFLFDTKDPDELTSDQKDTIRGIVSLTGVLIGSTTGDVNDAVSAGETALVAVEDNYWNKDPKHGSNSAQVVPDWMLPHMPVFGKNAKGQTIICIPTSSHSCGASSNFRVATDQEMVNSVKAGAVMIVGSAVGGKGAEYTLKIGGKIVNKYKTLKQAQKAAEDSVQKARVTNNNQIDDDLGNKPSGKREIAKGLNGKDFEDWLHSSYGGSKSFSKGGREFDGAFGNRWYEAKSGNYWRDVTSKSRGLEKFKSDMGARKRIANENGGTYELHSNTPIPKDIKDWLDKKGISSYEHQ